LEFRRVLFRSEVSLGDEQLGSFPVDDTLTDGTDEVGQTSVSVTVPEDLSDVSTQDEVNTELVVSVTDTPTQVALPVVLEVPDAGDDTGTADGGTEAGADAGPAAGTEDGADGGDTLPDTGASPMPWIIGAIVVLALGGGLYAWSRRRTSGGSSAPPTA